MPTKVGQLYRSSDPCFRQYNTEKSKYHYLRAHFVKLTKTFPSINTILLFKLFRDWYCCHLSWDQKLLSSVITIINNSYQPSFLKSDTELNLLLCHDNCTHKPEEISTSCFHCSHENWLTFTARQRKPKSSLADEASSSNGDFIVSIRALIVRVIMYGRRRVSRRMLVRHRYLILATLLVVVHPGMLLTQMPTQVMHEEIAATTSRVTTSIRLVLRRPRPTRFFWTHPALMRCRQGFAADDATTIATTVRRCICEHSKRIQLVNLLPSTNTSQLLSEHVLVLHQSKQYSTSHDHENASS